MFQWRVSRKYTKPPIENLPGELLVTVFRFLIQDWSLDIHSSRYPLGNFRRVCRKWAKLCEDPSLRRFIPLHSGLDFIEECLELSYSAPIVVVGTILDPDIIQVLSLHLFRISSLRLEVRGSATVLGPLLEAFRMFPPKSLETFSVDFRDGFAGCEDLLPTFSVTASEDHSLGVHVLPATIRYLHLSSSDPAGSDDALVHAETLELIRSLSTNLRTLTLGGSYLHIPYPNPSPEEQPYHRFRHPADSKVILPNLTTLTLCHAPWRRIVAAVVGLSAPALRELHLVQESLKETFSGSQSGPSEAFNQIKNCYVDRAPPTDVSIVVEQDENLEGNVFWNLPERDFRLHCCFWQQIGVFNEVTSMMSSFNTPEHVSLVLPESYNVSEKGWERLLRHCRATSISVKLHHSPSVVWFARENSRRVSDSEPRTFEHLQVTLGERATRFDADDEREIVVSLAECVPRGDGPLLFTLRGPVSLSKDAASALEWSQVQFEQDEAGWLGGIWSWK
ncbi:hypothetical protein DL96DRAFT_1578915 [Flagelloscypha sp. PMI_526]|nr:hypothetical protein DL96DRAFT_1578915 [Flagelloscypha sp. PMI_526]